MWEGPIPAALPRMMAFAGILGCGSSHEAASVSASFSVVGGRLPGDGRVSAGLAGASKSGVTGTLSWRCASGLAEWMSVSQATHSDAASALQVTTAGATSHTSHIHTRSCRDASLLAPCTLPSQLTHRNAASARQYTTALHAWQASQAFGILLHSHKLPHSVK